MKKTAYVLSIGLLLASTAFGQQPPPRVDLRRDAPPAAPKLEAPATTPEMWIYQQERQRYDDPKTAVRRNAEFVTAHRMMRIESRKWFGYSNSRPIASPNPWYDTYSPQWVGNTPYPYEWAGVGSAGVGYRTGWYPVGY
jgi:hypothetical protein